MSSLAIHKDGSAVLAESYSEKEWQSLKENYAVGDFTMPCCKAPAIPKTSQNYLQFFAHHSDECGSSPESQWHLATKEAVFKELTKLNLKAEIEKTGGHKGAAWEADVFFQHEGRKIAIEVQHSYQHLRDYLARQSRYAESGVEAYWLIYLPRYKTLMHS